MEQTPQENNQPVRRVRRKKSKWQVFKEAYMPVVILALAVILIIVFVVGSVSRGSKKPEETTQPSTEATEDPYIDQAPGIAVKAGNLAAMYDYDAALALIDAYPGNVDNVPMLSQLKTQLQNAKASLVPYTDIANVPHLSLANVICNIEQTKADATGGSNYLATYTTVAECQAILEALYNNNFVLVSLHDLYTITTDAQGNASYSTNTLYLPAGKKPIVLSQVHVNYYSFMVSSGFGSRMVLHSDGTTIYTEMVASDGTTQAGLYDLVPLLDNFLKQHPDFSYKGARATLALTGYQGVLGYRTQPDSAAQLGQAEYDNQVKAAKELAQALKDRGYEFACYSYGGGSYDSMTADSIREDLTKWQNEVEPILGKTDIFFLSMGVDIADLDSTYSGDKFEAMKDAGYEIFVGRETAMTSWFQLGQNYFRQTRRWITGENMQTHPEYFADLFDSTAIRDTNR